LGSFLKLAFIRDERDEGEENEVSCLLEEGWEMMIVSIDEFLYMGFFFWIIL